VQAWRNVSSKPLLANAEVSACRMFSFDNFDVAIRGKVLLHVAPQQLAVGCNVQQCLPMRPIGCHRLKYRFFGIQLVSILGDNIVLANFVQFDNDFLRIGVEVGMLHQCTFQMLLLPCLCTSFGEVHLHLPPQCKTLAFVFQFLQFWLVSPSN